MAGPGPAASGWQDKGAHLSSLFVAAAVGLGLLVRAAYVLTADFPLNDGGLFAVMIDDLRRAHYALPDVTTYNAAGIPFTYPPLGFYLAGVLAGLTGAATLDLLRFLPLLLSTASILAFWLLARSLLRSPAAVAAAVFAFALLPRGFVWLIMGGGLTRALGLLFAILALHQIHRLYVTPRRRYLLLGAIFAGLTLLSHAEMAWFLAFSAAVLFAAYGRSGRAAMRSLAAGAGALVVTAPWWATVAGRQGIGPFLAAGQSGSIWRLEAILRLIRFDLSGESLFPVLSALALLGLLACIAHRRPLLPLWLLAIALLDPRSLATNASVPLALLAGMGVANVLLPLLIKARELPLALATGQASAPPASGQLPARVLVLLGWYATLAAVLPLATGQSVLRPLPLEERAAMRWAAASTPPGSRFVVVSGAGEWGTDRGGEWFPALAERASVATPQGYEWVAGGAFARLTDAHQRLQACTAQEAACLDAWSGQTGISFTHVYLPKTPPDRWGNQPADERGRLRDSLRLDPGYRVVYDGPGATIFARGP